MIPINNLIQLIKPKTFLFVLFPVLKIADEPWLRLKKIRKKSFSFNFSKGKTQNIIKMKGYNRKSGRI